MTIEQEMQSTIDVLKLKIEQVAEDSKKMQKTLTALRKELFNKIKAKALFLGEKLPVNKPKKKKIEEVKPK